MTLRDPSVLQRDRRPASPGFLRLPLSVDRDLLVPRSVEGIPARAGALARDVLAMGDETALGESTKVAGSITACGLRLELGEFATCVVGAA